MTSWSRRSEREPSCAERGCLPPRWWGSSRWQLKHLPPIGFGSNSNILRISQCKRTNFPPRKEKNINHASDHDSDTVSGNSDDEDNDVNQDNNSIDKELYSNSVTPRTAPFVCRINLCNPDAGDVFGTFVCYVLHRIACSGWEHVRTAHGIILSHKGRGRSPTQFGEDDDVLT